MPLVFIKLIIVIISMTMILNAPDDDMGTALLAVAATLGLCLMQPFKHWRGTRKYLAVHNPNAIDFLPELKRARRRANIFSGFLWAIIIIVLAFTGLIMLLSNAGFQASPQLLIFAVAYIGLGMVYKKYIARLDDQIAKLTGQKDEQVSAAVERAEIRDLPADALEGVSKLRYRYIAYLAVSIAAVWVALSLFAGAPVSPTSGLFIILAAMVFMSTRPAATGAYQDKIKERFLPGILEKHGLTYSREPLFDMGALHDHGLVPSYWKQISDDAFYGTIRGRRIEVQDFILLRADPDALRREEAGDNLATQLYMITIHPFVKLIHKLRAKAFGEKNLYRDAPAAAGGHGVAVRIPLNRKLYCHTLVFSKGRFSDRDHQFAGYKKISLLKGKLTGYFDIYANDQVESRYIFDPAFMERFAELIHRLPMADIEVSFKGQELAMLCLSDKNFFEAGGLFSPLKPESFEPVIREIEAFKDIVELLELDPDRGL